MKFKVIVAAIAAVAIALVFIPRDGSIESLPTIDRLGESWSDHSQLEVELFSDELHAAILSQNREVVLSQLMDSAATAIKHIDASNDLSDADFVRSVLLEYFRDQGDWAEALNILSVMEGATEWHSPLVASCIVEFAVSDYSAAAYWLSEHSGWERVEIAAIGLGEVAGASEAPETYLEWIVDYLPTNTMKSAYYQGFFNEWGSHDLAASLAQLNEMPSAPVLDAAIHDFVINTGSLIDPAETMSWAESVYDADLKRSAITKAAEMMIQCNTEDYRLWRLHVQLPADIENQLP